VWFLKVRNITASLGPEPGIKFELLEPKHQASGTTWVIKMVFIRSFGFRSGFGSDGLRRPGSRQDLYLGLAKPRPTLSEATSRLVLGPFIGRKQTRVCPFRRGSRMSKFLKGSSLLGIPVFLLRESMQRGIPLGCLSGLLSIKEVVDCVLAMVAIFLSASFA
jgi:hypothetical protein